MKKSVFTIRPDIKKALDKNEAVIALESTILAHGMPFPENLNFAHQAEQLALDKGVLAATIAIIDGEIKVGLSPSELEIICKNDSVVKTSLRELGWVKSKKLTGATTVSSTLFLAHRANIKVFATGGIGGVHRGAHQSFDVSQDLSALSSIPMVVVSAGAKAILDLPKTLETLETLSVLVIGYKTNEFPSFYSRGSGLSLTNIVDSTKEIASIYNHHIASGLTSSLLIANPVPEEKEIPRSKIEQYIKHAVSLANEDSIAGKSLTPFLLKTISKKSHGACLKTNIALALNNVELGSEIATNLANKPRSV
jgi:pseudouridine-5'-phosphate glycosidase